jgi:MoxR-like ATPase
MPNAPEMHSAEDQQRAQRLVAACDRVRQEVARVIVGQQDVVEQLLIAILARGTVCWKVYRAWPRR